MASAYSIREAVGSDLDTIVTFTLREAFEAEGAELKEDDVRRGVRRGLEEPRIATYGVAESIEGQVVASTSVVTEWSNFNGGFYWWVQSMFIVPAHRGGGLVDLLLDTIADTARSSGAIDLRLYVHGANRRALEAYRRCGFRQAEHVIMQRPLEVD